LREGSSSRRRYAIAGGGRWYAPQEMLASNGGGHPVLVVEDDEDVREAVATILMDEGYLVVTASHGREALDVLTSGARPCLVLLDLMMPIMDGWQVLEEMQQHAAMATIPVIVLSASRDLGPPAPNVLRYLKKPIGLDVLLREVEAHYHGPVAQAG
jgi:two-component system chemotaxis response regulator CheY